MENSKSRSHPCSEQDARRAGPHHTQLRDAIINRLEQISERSQEQVLEYIQELMDKEERQLEFSRRQGRLYSWPLDDARA
jgi:hypothetical protein